MRIEFLAKGSPCPGIGVRLRQSSSRRRPSGRCRRRRYQNDGARDLPSCELFVWLYSDKKLHDDVTRIRTPTQKREDSVDPSAAYIVSGDKSVGNEEVTALDKMLDAMGKRHGDVWGIPVVPH